MPEPLLLDRFIPRYDHSVVYSQVFRALPEERFEGLVNMDILEIPLIRVLILARGLPQRIERGQGTRRRGQGSIVAVDVSDRGLRELGWIKLGERPGAEPRSDSSVSRGDPCQRAD